jgi:hypothetical protein
MQILLMLFVILSVGKQMNTNPVELVPSQFPFSSERLNEKVPNSFPMLIPQF